MTIGIAAAGIALAAIAMLLLRHELTPAAVGTDTGLRQVAPKPAITYTGPATTGPTPTPPPEPSTLLDNGDR